MLKQKLHNEMERFRKSYEKMTATQVYNDWYIIGFYEAYYDMLTSEWEELASYEHIMLWLCEFNNPLEFLYSEWLGSDGALNHDWDVMLDFIDAVYQDCVDNKY